MGAAERMWIVLPLVIALIVAVVVILRQQNQLDEERWMREKVWPLILEVEKVDPEHREYLDPAIVEAFLAGEIDIDEAIQRQDLHKQHA